MRLPVTIAITSTAAEATALVQVSAVLTAHIRVIVQWVVWTVVTLRRPLQHNHN